MVVHEEGVLTMDGGSPVVDSAKQDLLASV